MGSLKPFPVYDSVARLTLGKGKHANDMEPGIGISLACSQRLASCLRTRKKENPQPGTSIMAIPIAKSQKVPPFQWLL